MVKSQNKAIKVYINRMFGFVPSVILGREREGKDHSPWNGILSSPPLLECYFSIGLRTVRGTGKQFLAQTGAEYISHSCQGCFCGHF